MSGKELDNLFRNKLEELETTPSPQAWDKLQSGLAGQQKKIKYPYWRVAAAILLLAACGGIFWWSTQDMQGNMMADADNEEIKVNEKRNAHAITNSEEQENKDEAQFEIENAIAENNQNTTIDEEVSGEVLSSDTEEVTQEHENTDQLESVDTNSESENSIKKAAEQIDLQANNTIAANEQQTDIVEEQVEEALILPKNADGELIAKNNDMDATIPSNEASSVQEGQEEKSTVLVFDIEDFDKKTAVAQLDENAQEEVKQSRFKKILNFVKSVKEGDGGMAGLREAKDDLFTFDSKKEENDSE